MPRSGVPLTKKLPSSSLGARLSRRSQLLGEAPRLSNSTRAAWISWCARVGTYDETRMLHPQPRPFLSGDGGGIEFGIVQICRLGRRQCPTPNKGALPMLQYEDLEPTTRWQGSTPEQDAMRPFVEAFAPRSILHQSWSHRLRPVRDFISPSMPCPAQAGTIGCDCPSTQTPSGRTSSQIRCQLTLRPCGMASYT